MSAKFAGCFSRLVKRVIFAVSKQWGALILRAEIIPFKPDPDNAGGGNESIKQSAIQTTSFFETFMLYNLNFKR